MGGGVRRHKSDLVRAGLSDERLLLDALLDGPSVTNPFWSDQLSVTIGASDRSSGNRDILGSLAPAQSHE